MRRTARPLGLTIAIICSAAEDRQQSRTPSGLRPVNIPDLLLWRRNNLFELLELPAQTPWKRPVHPDPDLLSPLVGLYLPS